MAVAEMFRLTLHVQSSVKGGAEGQQVEGNSFYWNTLSKLKNRAASLVILWNFAKCKRINNNSPLSLLLMYCIWKALKNKNLHQIGVLLSPFNISTSHISIKPVLKLTVCIVPVKCLCKKTTTVVKKHSNVLTIDLITNKNTFQSNS